MVASARQLVVYNISIVVYPNEPNAVKFPMQNMNSA